MTFTNSWQILSWSWRASPSLERMDCQVLKQNMHIMGRFTLTAGAVGVGVDDGEEEVGDGASPCLSSLSLSTSLPPSPSSWQKVGRRLAFPPTMRWRRGWKGHFGRAIFWKVNFVRAFCDQSITLCAGHRRPSSETKVTSCNSLSFQEFSQQYWSIRVAPQQTKNSLSKYPLSLPRIY